MPTKRPVSGSYQIQSLLASRSTGAALEVCARFTETFVVHQAVGVIQDRGGKAITASNRVAEAVHAVEAAHPKRARSGSSHDGHDGIGTRWLPSILPVAEGPGLA